MRNLYGKRRQDTTSKRGWVIMDETIEEKLEHTNHYLERIARALEIMIK